MFFMWAAIVPTVALKRLPLLGASKVIVTPSKAIFSFEWAKSLVILPLGPVTVRTIPSREAWTPSGTLTDMEVFVMAHHSLVHVGHQPSANLVGDGFLVGEYSLRRCEDEYANVRCR